MKTKQFTALLISVLMILQMFVVNVAAAYIEQTDDPADIQFTVPWATAAWNPDGVIDTENGEYTKIDIKASQLSYAAATDELVAAAQQTDVTLYMSYSKNYVYFAAETPADKYVCEIDQSNEGNMWAAHALQMSLADITATASDERLEVGYALSSVDNEMYACSWFDPMGIAYDPDDENDYIVVRNGNTLIYEMRVPFEAFVEENLTEGDSFFGSVIWEIGTSEDGGSDAYSHIQLGYGVSGNPGKDPTGHATFTLGEIPEGAEDFETYEPEYEPDPDEVQGSSCYIDQEADPENIRFTVPYAETAWTADGVISDGEYSKLNVLAEYLSYATAGENLLADALTAETSLYMSYSSNYVYIAAETPAKNYVCDIDSSNEGNMWAAHAIQLSLADITATEYKDQLEVGYALSSIDNKLYAYNWCDPMGIAYDPDDNSDYTVVLNGDKLIYEMRVPFEAFVGENLTEGDSFLGSVVWAIGISKFGGNYGYSHIQLGYGLSGDPGKTPLGHATFTLGESPEDVEPEVTLPDITSIPFYADEIVIDGEKDSAYENAAVAVIDKLGIGETEATATAYMLTNNGLLYLYVDVVDPDVVIPSSELQASEPWYADSVEFLFQTRNGVFSDIHQFRVDVADYLSYYRNAAGDIQAYGENAEAYFIGHAAANTENGYAVEFCIDTKEYGVSAGEIIGIQLQLNDAKSEGNGDWACRNYREADGAFSADEYDEVLIGADEEYTTTRTEEPAEPITLTFEDGVLTVSGSGEISKELLADIDKSAITSLIIEEGITAIGYEAFADCTALEFVELPESLQIIYEWAFGRCTSLKTVTIGKNVTMVGACAFLGCSTLDYIVFDNCNPTIGDWAFEACSMLRYADLGNALTSIGIGMFNECTGLEAVYFRGNAPTVIGEAAFNSTLPDLRLCWFEGTEGWTDTLPFWKGPDGNSYLTLMLAPDTTLPIEFPDIFNIPSVDTDASAIVIDGEMDAAYADAAAAVIDKPGIGTPAAKATASMVADNGLLYVYVDVTDPDVIIPSEEVQANEPWYADSVEFLLHPRNEIFTDIHQFRVDVTGYLSYYRNSNGDIQAYGDAAEEYFVGHAAVRTDTGYVLEFCIDTKAFGISANELIGIQMQLNDVAEGKDWMCSHYRYTNNTFIYEHFDAASIGEGEDWVATLQPKPDLEETTMVDVNEIGLEDVDGIKDDIYTDATTAVCDKLMPGYEGSGASATATMVGHSGLLFLYIEVEDDDIQEPTSDTQENEPWETDSVEFFLWTHNQVFDNIHQFRLDVSGYPSYYSVNNLKDGEITSVNGEDAANYFEAYEVVRTENGYVIEACIDVRKYGISYEENAGIQMQLNDVTENGTSRYTYMECPENGSFATEYYDDTYIGGWLYSMTREYDRPEEAYRGVVAKIDADAIKIDGVLDEAAWADALQIPIGEKIQGHIGDGDTGTRGFAYMLWSDDKWYLYINVNDDHVETPIPEMQANEPWRTDSVEMFFDFGGKHEHIVEQFRLDCSGYPSYYLEGDTFHAYGEEAAPYFDEYAVTIDDEGYNIEMCLNLDGDKYGLSEGYEIGIQMQVNDMWEEIHPNDTAAVYVMGSALDARSWDIAYYDYITLGGPIESQTPDTTDYDAYLNASAETVQPGDTFTLEFFIPEEKTLTTSGFALSHFVYNEKCFAIDTENIEILVNPLIRDISGNGNMVMAFDGAKTLGGSIVRIPVTVLDTAVGGTFEISCTAQYQDVKTTSVMAVAPAVISVDQSILYGDLNSDGVITSADAVLLLWHVFLPDEYPIASQPTDYNGDGNTTSADAVYLLWHVFLPDEYPLY